jgi:predicted branched-subunit amino acid permease
LIFSFRSVKRNVMISSSPFREGVKAAVPIWIAYISTSLTLGIAAKAYGLHVGEIVLMSAAVFAAPAQFAALEPLASGKPALQIFLVTFLINLRFLVMSAAIAPYFVGIKRPALLLSSHLISISTFILPYVHFQKQAGEVAKAEKMEDRGKGNFHYFLGLAVTSFSVWVIGTGVGYWAALHVPSGFEEGLKFMLPGYFACILTSELRGKSALLITMVSFFAAVPGALLNTDWGWLVAALAIGTFGWGMEQWIRRGSR